MAVDKAQLETDLGNIIDDLPTVFTFAGITYSGVFTDLVVGKGLDEGGFVSDFDASLHARQSVFSTLPVSGVTVGIGNRVYRVERVMTSPDDAEIRMDLMTPQK